ncbi:hypothetical protein K663_16280 [Sphingobium sp. MI1205]|nr:hypothetical protein K663_16280 [Sphingobium sp. MI1205]
MRERLRSVIRTAVATRTVSGFELSFDDVIDHRASRLLASRARAKPRSASRNAANMAGTSPAIGSSTP